MSCPVHNTDDDDGDGRERNGAKRGFDRREFMRSALVIGGTGALSSLGTIAGVTPTVKASGQEPITAGARLNRQHAWDAYEPTAASGNTAPPPNSIFLMLDYQSTGEPSSADREAVEEALTEIEEHFAWNPGGVMFTIAYSASYFDRYDQDPPEGAAPDPAATVAQTVADLTDLAATNDDITPDDYDAVLLLSSNNASNLLTVEEALWGNASDVTFDATFEGIFGKPTGWPDRRVGFAGAEFQNREAEYESDFLDDGQDVPDEAPLSMGFIAGFGESMPREDLVTLKQGQRFPNSTLSDSEVPDLPYVGAVGERDPGVFAQGTLKHLAHLELDLTNWYDVDEDRRRHQMYSPYHDEAETRAMGGDKPGSGLTDADAEDPNEVAPDDNAYEVMEYAERTEDTANGEIASGDVAPETDVPMVGHSQKAARARYDIDGDGERDQPVLRRDWDTFAPTGENGSDTTGYMFNVPMRFNESIYTLLDANYNVGFTSLDGQIDHAPSDTDGIAQRNGIAPFMTATRRGHWLVPPVSLRALPYPRADQASLSVTGTLGTYTVEVSGFDTDGGTLDPDTVQFGSVTAVNQARGAEPTTVLQLGSTAIFAFALEDIDLSHGDTAKLFAKKEHSREPVVGTTTV